MRKFAVLAVLVTALVTALSISSAATAARPGPATGLVVPIDFTSTAGAFDGQFAITRFASQGGTVTAIGTLTGTVTNAAGDVVGTVNQALSLPLIGSATTGTCEILHLELGPLDLDLLGLVVHLDKVVLDITAQSGPGNLLGNLLCGIAGLLDGDAPANVIANLLNQLLAILNL